MLFGRRKWRTVHKDFRRQGTGHNPQKGIFPSLTINYKTKI
jgi:hypothetical protein